MKLAIIFLWILLLTACSDISERRSERAKRAATNDSDAVANGTGKSVKDIVIGLAWDRKRGQLIEGAEIARDEINAAGGVLGRPLKFIIADDSYTADANTSKPGKVAHKVARQFANNLDVVSVIGHNRSTVAIPASITYEEEGILYISPSASALALTDHQFQYVFRTALNNKYMGEQIATAAGVIYNVKKFVVLSTRATWAEELTFAFEENLEKLNVEVVFRRKFFFNKIDFKDIFADLLGIEFDGIFIAASPLVTVRVIKQAREMGINTAFVVGNFLHPGKLLDELDKNNIRLDSVGDIFVPIMFNPSINTEAVVKFRDAMFDNYKIEEPDDWAAQGYDAVKLLAYAIEQSNSTVPIAIATTIRYTLSWQGLTGRHSFHRSGDIYTKLLNYAHLQNGGAIDYITIFE